MVNTKRVVARMGNQLNLWGSSRYPSSIFFVDRCSKQPTTLSTQWSVRQFTNKTHRGSIHAPSYLRSLTGTSQCPHVNSNRTLLTSSTRALLQPSKRRNCFHFKRFSSTADDDAGTNNNSTASDNEKNPRLSVAIVGAGPSGFYAAKYLTSSVLKRLQSAPSTQQSSDTSPSFGWSGVDVDIIERLPTPYGLVRYGVAPDHPEVKNVENDFAALFQKDSNENSSPSSLSYFGNIDVGKDISLSQLQSLYDIVILAYGCQAADRRLGIPGEDTLEGVLSAREFVAWYNGHPEFGHIGAVVKRCLWPSSSEGEEDENNAAKVSPARVVVIGQGNVALDVARVLAKGKPGLIDTDTPDSVLEVLQGGATHVSVVGRRGHVQGAFTIKELRELTKLKKEGHDATLVVRQEELDLGMTESSEAELKGPKGRPKTRINKLLQESAAVEDGPSETSKQVELRFLMSPIRLEPNDSNSDHVGYVICERTKLEGEPFEQKPVTTNETETMPADLVLVSIGYRGMPLDGMGELLFDNNKGIVANDHGKVSGDSNLFVTGWIKRGPTGIIGTNIMDAKDTVASVMEFIDSDSTQHTDTHIDDNASKSVKGRAGLAKQLEIQNVEAIDWQQFLKIEAAESNQSRLRSDNQPREKFLTVKEMMNAAI
eukprot:CAMPEP_0183743048 /NCGR_PEP_ID=MMETSP0737-20130205/65015_1 /TAXON_ID=385413 /ORGANISM="Thalassiosira miniscula, Strain CCMP1093" /LENGTH=653 /DNA_ID=CAMNT_0025978651 /DNA_START=85 /DNA_END=2046 /DNA_ORIENTATION=+